MHSQLSSNKSFSSSTTNPTHSKLSISLFLILGVLATSCASKPPVIDTRFDSVLPLSWVEYGPTSQIIARHITRENQCPSIQIDSQSSPMNLRVAQSAEFSVTTCESILPDQAKQVQINGHELAIPKKNPKRIVVIGDTGCRVKTGSWGSDIQDCNNPDAWPFEKIAKKASEWKPDLVVHLGDYLYRESPCPAGNHSCEGSPIGDRWESWSNDFFTPGQSLIQAAPWIFVRGNHELCKRSGDGWARFLDPNTYSHICGDSLEPYWVKAGSFQAVVLDTAQAEDANPKEKDIQSYVADFKLIEKFPVKNAWLLTHRPFWAPIKHGTIYYAPEQLDLNRTLQAASKLSFPKSIDLIFSGHLHLFESVQFSGAGPSQIVVGNSGSHLTEKPTQLKHLVLGGRKVKNVTTDQRFGFMTLELLKNGVWKGHARDTSGKAFRECFIRPGNSKQRAHSQSTLECR